MRKIIFSLLILLLAALPLAAGAHGGVMDFGEAQTGSDMMLYVEGQALGDDLHEEMEGLMAKMMAGTLSQSEAGRVTELMNQYPGPGGMMMNRLMGAGGAASGRGMMQWGGMAGAGVFWFWIVALNLLVWLVVGLLAAAWLWRKLRIGK